MSHVWTLFLISNLDFLKCGVLAHVRHVASPKIYKYNFRLRNKKTFCQNAVIFNLKFIHIMLSPNDSSKRNYGNPHAIFQNANVPAATMAILTFFDNVLVIRNMLEIHFSKCKCPGVSLCWNESWKNNLINLIRIIFNSGDKEAVKFVIFIDHKKIGKKLFKKAMSMSNYT